MPLYSPVGHATTRLVLGVYNRRPAEALRDAIGRMDVLVQGEAIEND